MSVDSGSAYRGRWPTVSALVAFLLFGVSHAGAQPHALVPLPTPEFSVDRASPLNDTIPGAAASVLKKPGPYALHTGAGMGLLDPNDELDALSYDRSEAAPYTQTFLLLFGVDRATVGAVPPDPFLVSQNRPFNVFDQAQRNQHAGDLYLSLGAYDLYGPVLPKGPGRPGQGNNTLAINQGDTGGVDHDLSPTKAPVQQSSPATLQDDSDSAAYPAGSSRKDRTEHLFFSVSADSPSLLTLPGFPSSQSGADVFVDPDPMIAGNEQRYVAAPMIGLLPTPAGDDIDALIVLDDGDGIFDPGVDAIIFSLARGSPTLDLGLYSAADVLISRGEGVFEIFAPAAYLGLAAMTDNLDALELIRIEEPPEVVVNRHAIFLVWPGDFDHDGSLTLTDCAAFVGCYSGPGVPFDDSGVMEHAIAVGPGSQFNPAAQTIEAGDSVRWDWITGLHNVVSGVDGQPDGVFNSGPAATAPFTFQVSFDEVLLNTYPRSGGVYHYFSQPDLPAMVGEIAVVPHPCATFDVDYDGDVDCADWLEFGQLYSQATNGGRCLPLDVVEFVAALLGNPLHPAHTCIADANGDGALDGLDVQAYVDIVLHP